MFADIAEAPKPVAPAAGPSMPIKLETVPENGKVPARGLAKAPGVNASPPTTDAPKEFPTKTDKPRPHVCLTCKRSFARLEHLKRHERSHTKEKPFECPECTRCFARRDLLLRHQQKLHMTTTPSSRPRAGRRESTSSTISASGKIRKNSAVHSNASMRPRANTISNIGNPALEMFANTGMPPGGIHSPQPTMVFGRVIDDIHHMMRPHMVPGHHGVPSGLPKINTSIANVDMSGGLRTAPVFTDAAFGMDGLFTPDTTVNPAALHFPDGSHTIGLDSPSPFQELPGMHMGQMPIDMSASMDWMTDFGTDLSMINTNDSQAIAGSSPSVVDPDSPEDASEYAQDRKSGFPQHTAQWQGNSHFHKHASALPDYMMDMGLNDAFLPGPPSPSLMHDFIPEGHFPNPQFHLQSPLANPMTPPMHGFMGQQFPPPLRGAESPSTMASTTDNSARQSSIGIGFQISVPEKTREAMVATLAQPSTNITRQYSQPAISSPLSPGFAAKAQQTVNMPSTAEFQRYIVAYIKYFHPHMPFFHISTLSFDTSFSSGQSANGRSNSPVFGVANNGGCLILAMSAIGALYEGDTEVSKTLFNFSKRMLQMFMSEKIKADSSGFNTSKDSGPAPPPVWIVQAMLLNVIYGHMCGERTSETIAQQHGAALIGLARAANLLLPSKRGIPEACANGDSWNPRGEDPAWYEWRVAEEKKRTLYAVFNLSSFLTSAYNHSPALRNGEIALDLPCDEDLWAAESAEAWYALGGSITAEQNTVPFNLALNNLLTAHTRQPIPKNQMSQAFCKPNSPEQGAPNWPRPAFRTSTFGCLVLINALHNYIWETRQRHNGRRWTAGETDDMVSRIEPALVAWQALWSAVPHHSVERPNPFGMGPLAADSIPLLDLAYLVLTVNLGKSKECFWNRNFEEMSREIASGHEILQHAEPDAEGGEQEGMRGGDAGKQSQLRQRPESQDLQMEARKATRRERHLRKAAAHAANSLVLGARSNSTFADFTSRELPIQAGICVFTCAQVLAEWVATLQERVGPYLGILGVDHLDLNNVPAMVFLDKEDIILLQQIMEILATAEAKMSSQGRQLHNGRFRSSSEDSQAAEFAVGMGNGEAGYAARVLHISGKMLDSSSVWPVMKLMNQGLNVQARFMKERAERSRMLGDK